MPAQRSLLLIFRQAPYGEGLARDALDVALASAAFVPELAVLFMGDGVYQLAPDQEPSGIRSKRHAAMLEALPVYGVETLYAHEPSLRARGIDPDTTVLECKTVDEDKLGAFIDRFDTVLSF